MSCDSGSKSSDNLTDGINGANIERQLVLEAQLFDARKRIGCLIASNQSATAQNELLNSEIDQYRKTIKEQKLQIKKMSDDNDNLRWEISKDKGIRKFINNDTSGDMNDMVEKLNIAETNLSSFKQHVLDTANQLISTIDGDSAEKLMIPVHNAAAAVKDRAHLSTFKFSIFEKFSCFIVLVVFLVIVQSSELISVWFCEKMTFKNYFY